MEKPEVKEALGRIVPKSATKCEQLSDYPAFRMLAALVGEAEAKSKLRTALTSQLVRDILAEGNEAIISEFRLNKRKTAKGTCATEVIK